MIALRIVQGMGFGFTLPVATQAANFWSTKTERGTFYGIAIGGMALGRILAFPLGATLCYTGVDEGWPMLFYIPGIV
jgi:MFS family permease